MKKEIITTPIKSPGEKMLAKSPIPEVITEIINSTTRLTSGSLSDVVSGSSPEIDNTGSNSEVAKKKNDATGQFQQYLVSVPVNMPVAALDIIEW